MEWLDSITCEWALPSGEVVEVIVRNRRTYDYLKDEIFEHKPISMSAPISMLKPSVKQRNKGE